MNTVIIWNFRVVFLDDRDWLWETRSTPSLWSQVIVQQNVQDLDEKREERVQLTTLVLWVLMLEKMPWLLISTSRGLSAFAKVGSTAAFCKNPCPAVFVFNMPKVVEHQLIANILVPVTAEDVIVDMQEGVHKTAVTHDE